MNPTTTKHSVKRHSSKSRNGSKSRKSRKSLKNMKGGNYERIYKNDEIIAFECNGAYYFMRPSKHKKVHKIDSLKKSETDSRSPSAKEIAKKGMKH